MIVYNANNMLNELDLNYSGYNILKDLPEITSKNYKDFLDKAYPKCESISIDYAVLEKSDNIYVIPGSFGWDDIGTWMSLLRYVAPDQDGNYVKGNIHKYNAKNNIVYTGDKQIILVDAEDLFCIDTDEYLVIGKKDSISKLHDIRKDFVK